MKVERYILYLLLGLIVGCGDVLNHPPQHLPVIEAYFYTHQAPSPVRITRIAGLDEKAPTPITDASLFLQLPGYTISYAPSPLQPGIYLPDETSRALPGHIPFQLQITLKERSLTIQDTLPPPVTLEEVCLTAPSYPIEAVFADSLSLALKKGWIYPVTVRLTWKAEPPSNYWMHPRILPPASFPAAVVGFFLRTEEVFAEAEHASTWEGLYAVPVASRETPFPMHHLIIRLFRGTHAYAAFARTRTLPESREPISNIPGGRGLVVGLAADSLHIYPEAPGTTCFTHE